MPQCTGRSHSADIRYNMESFIVTIERKDSLPIMKTKPKLVERIGSLLAKRRNREKT